MFGDYIRGNVDAIILKCLGAGELYGGEISKLVFVASEGTFELKKPTLYSALKRLEHDKFVSVRTEESPIGGTRHYYTLTSKGTEVLANKKFDWVYSKLLIDNLVLDKKVIKNDLSDDAPIDDAPIEFKPEKIENPLQTAAATSFQTFIDDFADKASNSRNVAVAIANPITDNYITVPLSHAKPFQIAYDLDKVEAKSEPFVNNSTLLKAFVKHNGEKKSGKFVLYNRLRFTCASIASILMIGLMTCSALFLKDVYTSQESNFFMVGWVGIGVYLLSNLVVFSAYPKYKQVVNNKTQGLVRRAVFSACIAVTALSINVIAGLSTINATDFLVYCIVPCIVGSAFLLEGLAIWALRRASFFLT
ncbi:MAG: PadR family transcriptional regulator [Christensenellaceae bacterium]|nr:PadR family transcriptional regulator [Christensenellaceae bacterium]